MILYISYYICDVINVCGNSRIQEIPTTYDLPGYNPGSLPNNSCVEDIYVRMFWGDDVALRTYSHNSSQLVT